VKASTRLIGLFCVGAFSAFAERSSDFGEARWLWPQELGCVTNATVEFRLPFVARKSTDVRLAMAADTVYAVRLNGGPAEIGRFPNVPPRLFYDVVELGRTCAGTNELLVTLYVQGRASFQHIPGRPGVLFALRGDGVSAVSGLDVDWRLSVREMRENVPLVTSQLGYSFVHDATVPERPWKKVAAGDLGPGAADLALRRLPVPRCAVRPAVRERLIAQGRLDGSAAPDTLSIASGMDRSVLKPMEAKAFFADDGRSVRPEVFESGFYLLADLGREEAGLLTLDVDTDAGVTIDVGHAEHAENGRIRTALGPRSFAGRYVAAAGRNDFCRWARRMAGRYLQLHVRGVKTHFILSRLSVKPVEFPVREMSVPDYLRGDAREIWKTCVRTLRLCMHEHYEDCPWREQALYANDARNQMLAGYFAFGRENPMPSFCISLLSEGIGDDGWISLCVPSVLGRPIPSFTFSWVLSVADHLAFCRDVTFTRRMMPSVAKVLDRRASELKGGLLPCPTQPRNYWHFYDWAKDLDNWQTVPGNADRFDAPLNLFCLLAFEAGARCAEATGDSSSAVRWHRAAADMRTSIRSRFWNEKERRVETGLGCELAPAELVQSLALLADVVPKEARRSVAEKLLGPSDWTETTLSQSLYKYQALIAAEGDVADRAVAQMTAEWKRMLDGGATSFWEVKEGWTAFDNAASLCHGWSAIPIFIYCQRRSSSVSAR